MLLLAGEDVAAAAFETVGAGAEEWDELPGEAPLEDDTAVVDDVAGGGGARRGRGCALECGCECAEC